MKTYRQPFKGEYPISQGYGEVIEGVTYKGKPHTGIDYLCPFNTEILASGDGTVLVSGFDVTGYGNWILILHERTKATIYAHLSERYVYTNQIVHQGDIIGLSGSSGYSTGPHLHFEVRERWNDPESHRDPVTWLPLMTVDDSVNAECGIRNSESEDEKPSPLRKGVCRIACLAAYVRDWDMLNRKFLLKQGDLVYAFDDVKWLDNLPFRFIGAGLCVAEYDCDGTVILENVNDGKEDKSE